jgi:hypothetical protein
MRLATARASAGGIMPRMPTVVVSPKIRSVPLRGSLARRGRWLLAGAFVSAALVACGRSDPLGAAPQAAPTLSQNELAQADQRAQMCTAANAVGVGLRGEYFRLPALAGEVLLRRVEPTIDFDAALEWPAELAAQRPQSVRWSGWIKPPLSGLYRLHVTAPGAKLFVANREFLGTAAADARIDLAAGRFYPLRIEWDIPAQPPVDRVRLEWTAPHGARYVVPRPLLFQPTETVRATGS